MNDRRRQLRTIYDSAADNYQRARPDYPSELYDELIRLTARPYPGTSAPGGGRRRMPGRHLAGVTSQACPVRDSW